MNEASNFPILILTARPQNEIPVPPGFFDSQGSFFKLLQEPKYLRYSGWNLRTIDTPTIKDGNAWKVRNGERKMIILYENLVLLTGASLGPDFLAWGSKEENIFRVNSVAVAEYTYEFARLYHDVLTSANAAIKTCKINVATMYMGLDGKKVELGINPIGNYVQFPGKLLDEDFNKSFEVNAEMYDPKKVGFQILELIFRQFGYPSDVKMPYADLKKREIDVEGILKLGG